MTTLGVRRVPPGSRPTLAHPSPNGCRPSWAVSGGTFSGVEQLYGEVRYAADQARPYLAGEPSDISTVAIGSIVAWYVREHMKELREVVEMIDGSYQQPDEQARET